MRTLGTLGIAVTFLWVVTRAASAATAVMVQEDPLLPPDAVLELHQDTLQPGTREVAINLFDQYLVEGQEQCAIRVVGQFRDLDDQNRFVWLRSFADMTRRPRALTDFYGGLAWKQHGVVATSTTLDASNVLLLRPARPKAGFSTADIELALARRRPPSTHGPGLGLISAHIVYLREDTPGSFVDFFDHNMRPLHEAAGAWVIGKYVSESSANNFPQMPLRENERVFVWFSSFANEAAFERYQRNLAASKTWPLIGTRLSAWTDQPIETLRLKPTARSLLHG